MRDRICSFCGFEIPLTRNYNSSYCSQECYYENKKSEAAISNKKKRDQLLLFKNDDIIDELFGVYGSNFYISAKLLIDRNFTWEIHTGEVLINNIKANKLVRYAYTLYNNQTIQLWKL